MFYEYAFWYLVIGLFVAGSMAREREPRNSLSVPATAVLWPIYVIADGIHSLVDPGKVGE